MVAASKLSAKKIRANRLNARKSTGPRTLAGKARSCENARTHGAFCQDVVLDDEDPVAFACIRRRFIERLRPQDLLELSLVERIAEGSWRLMRLSRREAQDERESNETTAAARFDQDEAKQMALLGHLLAGGGRSERSIVNSLLGSLGAGQTVRTASLDPFGAARQRVEQSISRAMKELRLLQGPARPAELPPSPYLEIQPDECIEQDDRRECDQSERSQDSQNEPTAATSLASSDSSPINAPPTRETPPPTAGRLFGIPRTGR
jgi:hypothetical protein